MEEQRGDPTHSRLKLRIVLCVLKAKRKRSSNTILDSATEADKSRGAAGLPLQGISFTHLTSYPTVAAEPGRTRQGGLWHCLAAKKDHLSINTARQGISQ